MSPETDPQSWESYRRMIIDWHKDDVKAHEHFDAALVNIQTTLTEMRTERRVGLGFMNVLVPALVALASVGIAHAMGW